MKKLLLILLCLPLITLAQYYEFDENKANQFLYITHIPEDWTNKDGVFINSKGHQYVGEWKDDKFHGQGMLFADNNKLERRKTQNRWEGVFKNGKLEGQGTWLEITADVEGNFFNPQHSEEYVGEWKDGKFHGQGTKKTSNGEEYIGEWKDGWRDGQGKYKNQGETYEMCRKMGGETYEGEWKNNSCHGQGSWYCFGMWMIGRFENDKFIEGTRD